MARTPENCFESDRLGIPIMIRANLPRLCYRLFRSLFSSARFQVDSRRGFKKKVSETNGTVVIVSYFSAVFTQFGPEDIARLLHQRITVTVAVDHLHSGWPRCFTTPPQSSGLTKQCRSFLGDRSDSISYLASGDFSVVARSILPNMCPPIAPCCHVPA